MLKNIGIIGNGFVGKAVKESFKNHFEVFIFDLDQRKANVKTLEELISKCKMIFLCLPTPMNLEDGSCHLGIIEDTLKKIDDWCDEMEFYGLEQRTIIIKSTIQPGTTEKWNKIYKRIDIAFNPEFLTEANFIEDFKNQDRIIIGGKNKKGLVNDLYEKSFPKAKIINCSYEEAEMVKYFTNTFLATKVSFANEMFELCNKLNINYNNVYKLATLDKRLGFSHFNVPGPDGSRGFGGSCLPKDINAILNIFNTNDLKSYILESVWERNINKDRKEQDWKKLKGRAVTL